MSLNAKFEQPYLESFKLITRKNDISHPPSKSAFHNHGISTENGQFNIPMKMGHQRKNIGQTPKSHELIKSVKKPMRRHTLGIQELNAISSAKRNNHTYFRRICDKKQLNSKSKTQAQVFSSKDEHGNCSLFYAVGNGHRESTAFILKSGMDVNIKNEDGNT